MRNSKRTTKPAGSPRLVPLELAQTLLLHPSWVPWLRLFLFAALLTVGVALLSAALVMATLINTGMIMTALAATPSGSGAWIAPVATAAAVSAAATVGRARRRRRSPRTGPRTHWRSRRPRRNLAHREPAAPHGPRQIR